MRILVYEGYKARRNASWFCGAVKRSTVERVILYGRSAARAKRQPFEICGVCEAAVLHCDWAQLMQATFSIGHPRVSAPPRPFISVWLRREGCPKSVVWMVSLRDKDLAFAVDDGGRFATRFLAWQSHRSRSVTLPLHWI